MSLSTLQPNGLYVILFLRNQPHMPNDFHWGLYLHRDRYRGGTKYHIKQQGSGWITDHGVTSGVFKSFLLIGLLHIATVPQGLEGHVDEQLRSLDSQLNDFKISCRIWLFRVLELLQKEVNGVQILKCDNLSELEAEIKSWGNDNADSAIANNQPRPVGRSRFL